MELKKNLKDYNNLTITINQRSNGIDKTPLDINGDFLLVNRLSFRKLSINNGGDVYFYHTKVIKVEKEGFILYEK